MTNHTSDIIHWGIMSTGSIARQFVQGLAELPDAECVAVGSRTQASADSFGEEFGVPHRHANYEALVNDPDVDVIYIGTPHVFHMDNALLCLDAGKPMLCEKPFTINAAQARRVVDRAREKGLFLMEAMWTRFFPAMDQLRAILSEGTLGELRMLYADFGFCAEIDPQGRLFNLELGGGALLDVGIYPVSLASMLFGPPTQISSQAHIGVTGVDEQTAIILGYENGELALLSAAIRTITPRSATLIGTAGTLVIERNWWEPNRLTLVTPSTGEQTISVPYAGNCYQYEAAAVGECLRAGKLEHELIPLDESIQLMETLDAIRAPWGLKYPGE